MTVKLENGTATVPLWAVIVLGVSILLAGGGFIWGAVQKGADAEHRVMSAAIADENRQIESLIADNKRQDLTDQQLRESVIRIEEQTKAILSAVARLERRGN